MSFSERVLEGGDDLKIRPAIPFSNGMSYEIFCENFCYRCKKGKINSNGFPEYIENGGCPIWDAMECARFGGDFPSDKIVQVLGDDGCVKYWEVCTEFDTDDKDLANRYRNLFLRSGEQ